MLVIWNKEGPCLSMFLSGLEEPCHDNLEYKIILLSLLYKLNMLQHIKGLQGSYLAWSTHERLGNQGRDASVAL